MRPSGRFESLPVWQKAMDLAVEVRRLLPLLGGEGEDAILDEMARASLAIPSRIARGHGMGTRAGWAKGLAAASGAAARTEAALTLGIEVGRFAGDDVMPVLRRVREVARMLGELLEETERS